MEMSRSAVSGGARHLPARCSRSLWRTAFSWTSPISRAPWPKEQVSHTSLQRLIYGPLLLSFIYALYIYRFTLRSLQFSGSLMCACVICTFVVCLDGSPPAYHLAPGFGSGMNSWLVHFEVSCHQASSMLYLILECSARF